MSVEESTYLFVCDVHWRNNESMRNQNPNRLLAMEKFKQMLARTSTPVTVDSLTRDLRALGVESGMTLIVHSSLSSLGWVCGGAAAVILALIGAVGEEGTLVMPTQSSILSDPKYWRNPPIPESWWEIVRESMPAYRPDLTPTGGMGRIPETFRKMEGVLRSGHPKVSFAAWGASAQKIVGDHSLNYPFGEESPLARLYETGAYVLLIGVGYESCTALHLAEHRADYPGRNVIREGAPILVNGERRWVEYDEVEEGDDFDEIGKAFEEETGNVLLGDMAGAASRLIPVAPLVDFAFQWLPENRKA